MSNVSLDLLIEAGLLTAGGKPVDISHLPNDEISKRLSHYITARAQTVSHEVDKTPANQKLNALFSTTSADLSLSKILSSTLVYDSVIVDDPFLKNSSSLKREQVIKGINFFSWVFSLVRSNFVQVLPISFFNEPSDRIPILYSEDAFKSSIPAAVHDYVHKMASLASVVPDQDGNLLVLNEAAHSNRRPALNVSFKDDLWKSGVSLYLFQTLENGKITWDKNKTLSKEDFEHWAYQTINQAVRARLACIYNETHLASITSHTYITESCFEANLLAMSGNTAFSTGEASAKFLKANDSFIQIDSPETVVTLRDKYFRAFERFNYSLLDITNQLSNVNPEDFDQMSQTLFHKEIMPQIDEIRDNLKSISSSSAKGFLGSVGGLSAAVATGSVMPLIPALGLTAFSAATEALPAICQQQNYKNKPAFIWHRITKKHS